MLKNDLLLNYQETLNSFKVMTDARDINQKHISEIKEYMRNGGEVPNITVEKNTGWILDGNHRVEAVKQLLQEGIFYNLGIDYKDFGGDYKKSIEYVIVVNCTPKKWADKDFVKYYRKPGNDYDKLVQFAETHPLLYNVPKTGRNKGKKTLYLHTAAFFIKGALYTRNMVRNGKFTTDNDELEIAEEIYNEVKHMLEITGLGKCRGNWFEGFVIGWHNFRNKRSTERAINKLKYGIDSYFDAIKIYLDKTPTTSPDDWNRRFEAVLQHCMQACA